MSRVSRVDLFMQKVDQHGPPPSWRPSLGPCWIWTASLGTWGYGQFNNGKRMEAAHRWSYKHFVGPIPDGLHIDHLCHEPTCVRPDHLEPVTRGENTRRGLIGLRAFATHCLHGHEFTPENTYHPPSNPSKRQCRVCKKDARQRWGDKHLAGDLTP